MSMKIILAFYDNLYESYIGLFGQCVQIQRSKEAILSWTQMINKIRHLMTQF